MKPATYFVDTSAWCALLISTDHYHVDVATAYVRAHGEGANFVTTSLVLGELYTILSLRQSNIPVYWAFRDKLLASTRIRILHPTAHQIQLSLDLLRNQSEHAYTFVDATSFVVMQEDDIHTAFTLDINFLRAGFETFPSPSIFLHETRKTFHS